MTPRFFTSAAAFRAWLDTHHDTADHLLLGFYKKHAANTGISYTEALDEALCAGWIDGVRTSLDADRYTIRFTPRRPRSIWSVVNTRKVAALEADGRMKPEGRAAFAARDGKRTARYSYERRAAAFDAAAARQFKANPKAWLFFESLPPWYQKTATWWVVSAVKPETRQRRLAKLIDESAHGRWLPEFIRPAVRAAKT